MDIQGKGAKAFDADLLVSMYKAKKSSSSGKISQSKMKTLLNDSAHELRDQFEGETSSRGLTTMSRAIKNTAKDFLTSGWLTKGAETVLKDFVSTNVDDSELAHAIKDIKSEVAYNRRQGGSSSSTSSSTNYGT